VEVFIPEKVSGSGNGLTFGLAGDREIPFLGRKLHFSQYWTNGKAFVL
jgi:hypothetical protein